MKQMLAVAAVLLSGAALAEGAVDPFTGANPEAGAAKGATCVACHGPGGNSTNPEWPKLAGQHANYIVGQLQRMKSGDRQNAVMMGQLNSLSDQDIKDVAAYFAAQNPQPGVGSPASLQLADPLYRNGDAKRGLPACGSCHGPKGAGNAGAGYPRIGGQHAVYVAKVLRDYRTPAAAGSKRANTMVMAAVASKLSEPEIDALASYINGLQ